MLCQNVISVLSPDADEALESSELAFAADASAAEEVCVSVGAALVPALGADVEPQAENSMEAMAAPAATLNMFFFIMFTP